MDELMNEEEKNQTREVESFLKEAFCIDGSCNYIEDVKIKTTNSAMFCLTDSKRGRFYVTISK